MSFPRSLPGSRAALAAILVALVALPAFGIEGLKVGDAMPTFELPKVDESGGLLGSSSLAGKPCVLIFWRPGQRFSAAALGDLQKVIESVGRQRVHVVAVDALRSTPEVARRALSDLAFTLPAIVDPDRVLYGRVGVVVCPTTLIFDAGGTLRYISPSHPQQYRTVVTARLQFLLGEITEEEMEHVIAPTVRGIETELAAAWRMYNLGKRMEESGELQKAHALFEQAVARYPSFTQPRCALGYLKLSEGDLAKAAVHFDAALAYEPNSPDARLGRAAVLARNKKGEEAEKILQTLVQEEAIAARVRYELGLIYRARGETEKAMEHFQAALEQIFPESRKN